ncbi:MAG: hypothetical protein ACRDQF_00955 [Thermocrispum sp.]
MRVPDIGVGPQSLRAAAKGSREMAVELRAIEARVADRVTRAMPDSGAASNAPRVGGYWAKKLTSLSSSLDGRSDKLEAAADEYDSGERDSKTDFDATMPPAPREKRYPGW